MSQRADRPRVVFDCNVLIQAVSNAGGPAGRAIGLLERNLIEVCVSRAVLNELRAVLRYPTVREKLPGLDDERVDLFIERLAFRATLARHVPHVFDYPRAKQDEPYIDLAAAVDAHYLVSRDKDLLSLSTDHSPIGKQFRQCFPRLSVVNPVAFLSAMSFVANATE
jgi:putative PIN family toxin of toxin-antitoxin system